MDRKVLFVIFLVSFCYVEIFSKRLYVIVPNTETCKILDPAFVRSITCKSKNFNRTLNIYSKEIIYQPGVSIANFYANVVFYRKFATIYRQFMVDIHIDLCALLAGNKTVATQFINLEPRRKYGNLNDPCPISGRRYEYNVPMEHLDNATLPEIFPSGEYRIDRKSYTIVNGEKKFITLTQSYGEVKYTTAEQWKK